MRAGRGRDYFLVTCEHGGNRVPPAYRQLFLPFDPLLESHRGYDPGALVMARELAAVLEAPLFFSTVSRLVVDLNRSLGHPRLYSEVTRVLPRLMRQEILERHYLPYRNRAEALVAEQAARGYRVIHISSHSFTPELEGQVRDADIGLLYDPGRAAESELCKRWQVSLQALVSTLRVRRNYPYAGKSDGFTAYLRCRFPAERYLGIELEINQKHILRGGRQWRQMRQTVTEALARALDSVRPGTGP